MQDENSRIDSSAFGPPPRNAGDGSPGRPPAAGRPAAFDRALAFSRNLGWLTEYEQLSLRFRRAAIAGMGGVGGAHLITLARLGLGRFHIADFDVFEVQNFNRQAGAAMSTVGRAKADVMAAQALDINPDLELRVFDRGVDAGNVDAFLRDVDVYIDGLDFFAFDARAMVFAECARRGIPAVTAAPLGMGAALLVFAPGGMTFEEYFGWAGCDDDERALRFAVGLAPSFLHMPYLVDRSTTNLAERRGPSTPMACQICAGVTATETLKLLVGRGPVRAAPHGIQYDAFRQRLAHTWRPGGHRNPLQRLALAVGRRQLAAVRGAPT